MKRTPLRKVGKVGRANIEANKRIREQNPPQYCERSLGGCLGTMFLQIAHRHKRAWYKGDVEKLSDPKQFLVLCQNCHDRIEHDAELTEKIFMRLRGPE